ncbi:sigma E protease regulator RseP [Parashewanella curva]|uniref:Zinc metalloprotease n=1 Tax=Parashewanella curva TaxID=2338552 RepID=A0A3L8PWS6_9GAMM|nr:sigma E protease regulator RseP [Parashewanella curva]RLV59824.1 sigma E protease regulator RseP [Parashewanella curva]
MMEIIRNLGFFILAIGILVTVHEYGHFWVARRCGVKVERFSIGFGKALWSKYGKDGTEYVIAMIPLGGYVKMLDERVETVPEHLLDQAFNRKNVWQRIAVVAAGPIANFLFAVFALWIMFLIGVPSIKPIFESTIPNSPASIIQPKEPTQILAVNGHKVRDWEEVNLELVGAIGSKTLPITVSPLSSQSQSNADEQAVMKQGRTYQLNTENWKFDPDKESPITSLGLHIYRPKFEPIIAQVTPNSAAEKAGIQKGDKVLGVDGKPYKSWEEFVNLVQSSANKSLKVLIERNGHFIERILVPMAVTNNQGKEIGQIGVAPELPKWPENMRIQLEYGIVGSLTNAVDKTWQLTSVSLKTIAKLFTGDVSVKSLSGPISIAQGAGRSAEYGLVRFLSFLALISVSLGIINLLPIPVLDGGHLLYYIIEAVTGKPVPEKVQDIGFRIGAALLLMLMSVALFNDFSRLS